MILTPTFDTYIYNNEPDEAHNDSATLIAVKESVGDLEHSKGILAFDIDAPASQAILTVAGYAVGFFARSVRAIHLLNTDVTEDATWESPDGADAEWDTEGAEGEGTDYTTENEVSASLPSEEVTSPEGQGAARELDITDMYNAALALGGVLRVLLVRDGTASAGDKVILYATESETAAFRPFLTVTPAATGGVSIDTVLTGRPQSGRSVVGTDFPVAPLASVPYHCDWLLVSPLTGNSDAVRIGGATESDDSISIVVAPESKPVRIRGPVDLSKLFVRGGNGDGVSITCFQRS